MKKVFPSIVPISRLYPAANSAATYSTNHNVFPGAGSQIEFAFTTSHSKVATTFFRTGNYTNGLARGKTHTLRVVYNKFRSNTGKVIPFKNY